VPLETVVMSVNPLLAKAKPGEEIARALVGGGGSRPDSENFKLAERISANRAYDFSGAEGARINGRAGQF
jgi:hypothetical protein